uniref:Uncharacterized protein n=1 Tax=Ditylenchus dipsaci TaxID=166011 RepID=A0A915E3Q6_9BILA
MQAAVGGDLRILVYNVPYPKEGVDMTPASPAPKTVTKKKARTGVAKTPSTEQVTQDDPSPKEGDQIKPVSKSPMQGKNPRSKQAKSRAKSPKGKTAKSPAPRSPHKK